MTVVKARDLGKPPGICNVCWADQTHHPADEGEDAFHCYHNEAQAVVKADYSGWLVETGVSLSEYVRRAEAAEQALAMLEANRKSLN